MAAASLALSLAACAGEPEGAAPEEIAAPEAAGSPPEALPPSAGAHSERAGIGLVAPEGPIGAQLITVDARRSLAVTDQAILAPFTLQAVLNQLIAQSGGGMTAAQLYRQLWDTQNPAPGQPDLPGNAHCSDNAGTLNGFPYPCRLGDGQQALPGGPVPITAYVPIGLFNRFDLAPASGANCGEYRAVFGKAPGVGPGRSFIIFEAVLPNPTPALGLKGCLPVAKLWASLSDPSTTVASRTTALRNFYFVGLPGFPPVFHINHYGATPNGGQVRTNQFVQPPWLLREFQLRRICASTTCLPRFVPATVKVNPAGNLFNPTSTHPLAAAFRAHVVSQVPNLAVNDINLFSFDVPNQFNIGQSDSQTPGSIDNYVTQFGAGPSPFHAQLQAALTAIGSPLTPAQIVARAQTQSCGGCHQRSNGAPLGGFSWPPSHPSGFVQNSEFPEAGPDGTRFQLSPALTGTFLPHRKVVFEAFLNAP